MGVGFTGSGSNFEVFDDAEGLGDSRAIFPKPFDMKLDGRTNFVFDFFHCLSSRYAARQVWYAGGIVALGFFDDDGVAHG
jgi:hypothetical protein